MIDPSPVCVLATVISGRGETEALVRLTTAELHAAAEVIRLSQDVRVDDCEAADDQVLLNATLRSSLQTHLPLVDLSEFISPGCRLTLAASLLSVMTTCPVSVCVPVEGACAGDSCVVESAAVEVSALRLADTDGDGLVNEVEADACVRFRVRTERQQSLTLPVPSPPGCPPRYQSVRWAPTDVPVWARLFTHADFPDWLSLYRGRQGDERCLHTLVLVGVGETEELHQAAIDLSPLSDVLAVTPLTTRVLVTDCEVFPGFVAVQGEVRQLLQLYLDAGRRIGAPECTVTVLDTSFSLLAACPFSAQIPVAGACPGDACHVELACVDADQNRLVDTDRDGFAERFEVGACIRLRATVLRSQEVHL